MLFDRAAACKARSRKGGLRRAAFWRALGFPNLVLARAKWKQMREERAQQQKREYAQSRNRTMLDSTRDDNY